MSQKLDSTLTHKEKPDAEKIDPCNYEAVFISCDSEEEYRALEHMAQQSGYYEDLVKCKRRVHFISGEDFSSMAFVVQSPFFGSFLGRRWNDAEETAAHLALFVKLTQKTGEFGLVPMFGEGNEIKSISFDRSTQKQEGVEAVKSFMMNKGFKSRMAAIVANAVDELLMNAMFDAPVSDDGSRMYSQTSRDTEIKLEGRHKVELQAVFDGQCVAVSVLDQWGSLIQGELFQHMSKRFIEEEYQVKGDYAGAGIGLATVYRSGGSFIFRAIGGKQTEVTVLFRMTDNFRLFKEQFRFISTQFY